jgi:hypothetical protein
MDEALTSCPGVCDVACAHVEIETTVVAPDLPPR